MDDRQRIALVDTRTQGNETGVPAQLIRYQFGNHLGSATLELDDAAQIISYEEYYAYGSTSYQAGRSAAEVSLKRYRYTGKERDEESGLYYYGARYYAAWLGRWLSCDPVSSSNRYVYVENNPVALNDPDGREPACAGQKGCELSTLEYIRYGIQSCRKSSLEEANEQQKLIDWAKEENYARTVQEAEEKAARGPSRWDRFMSAVREKISAASNSISDTKAMRALFDFDDSLKETARNVGSETLDNAFGGIQRAQQAKGASTWETAHHLGGEIGELGYEKLRDATLSYGGEKLATVALGAVVNFTTISGKRVKSWAQGVLVGTSERQFRKAAERIIRDTQGHPLKMLLQNGGFRNQTAKGIDAVDWLNNPLFVEAGHVISKKSGKAEKLILMSAEKNRRLSAAIEHPKGANGWFVLQHEALDIGGVAVDVDLANDLVNAGHLSPTVVQNAKKIQF
jgi:RHS repeat-associated protein